MPGGINCAETELMSINTECTTALNLDCREGLGCVDSMTTPLHRQAGGLNVDQAVAWRIGHARLPPSKLLDSAFKASRRHS